MFIRVLRLGLDNFAFDKLWTSLEDFGSLRTSSENFGLLRESSEMIVLSLNSQHSQDKDLMLISQKKLAGILSSSMNTIILCC